jgi:glycosyltransferase involved in cell wall biosynthesis
MEHDIKLSILICTLPEREDKLRRIFGLLLGQIPSEIVGITFDDSVDITIGEKRNNLIKNAGGEYVCFVDDDDLVSKDYVSKILEAIETKPDCVGIQGIMLSNGNCPRRFFHTIEVDCWYTNRFEYYRTPNHLNPIRREIAMKVPFNQYSNFGEDREFSIAIKPFLKSEVMIDGPVYYYLYNLKPNETMF